MRDHTPADFERNPKPKPEKRAPEGAAVFVTIAIVAFLTAGWSLWWLFQIALGH